MGVEGVSSPAVARKILEDFVPLKSSGERSLQVLNAILDSLYFWQPHNSRVYDSRKTINRIARRVNLEDVICISKTLFEQLSKSLCVPLDNSSTDQSFGEEKLLLSESDAAEKEIVMLLRCCIASLKFLEFDQCQLVGRCDFLHRILSMLCSCQKHDISEGCNSSFPMKPDIHSRLVCRILEVFMDELIKNKSLSECIKISASFSPARQNLCHCVDSGYVMKVALAHFIQSCSGVQAFEGSVENLICTRKENQATPEVSLTAAVSLLMNPALASPAFLHAHLISLISDVIGRVHVYDHTNPSLRFIGCHMTAFEMSVSLYHRQLPKLIGTLFSENDDSFIKSAIPRVGRQRPFESYVCRIMNKRLDSMLEEIDCSSCIMVSQTNSNMVEILNGYVKENLHLLDESCRSIASPFLSFLVEKAISAESDDASLHMSGKFASDDMYLLASILKLMSCSLLQTVLYLSIVGPHSVHHIASSGDSFPSKENHMLIRIFDSFRQYRIQLPVQKLLHDKLEAHFSTISGSKLMFVHFTGLLSICLAGGTEILAKGCLYMMLNLMNLLFLEDGSLNLFSQLISYEMECELPHPPPPKDSVKNTPLRADSSVGMQEGHTNKKSSLKLASKFKKIRMSYMRKESPSASQDEKAGDMRVEDETINGTVFLRHVTKNSGSSALDEELANWIECKQGKDYPDWFENRKRCRTRRYLKAKDQDREIMKAAWRSTRQTRKAGSTRGTRTQ